MTDTIALFADVMGFAAAIDRVSKLDSAVGLNRFDFYSSSHVPVLPDKPGATELAKHRVWKLYAKFHNALKRLQQHSGPMKPFDEMIVFSDSAFIIKHHWGSLDDVAATLMSECFAQGVPLRIGIARGDFVRLPFSTVQHPSGMLVTEAPFLGSSIVRAYRAQSQGCPGFRILVHPSIRKYENAYIARLPKQDRSAFSVGEVNWLLHGMPYRELPDLDHLIGTLTSMREGISDQRVLRHYDATEQSIRRLHSLGWNHKRYHKNWITD